MQCLQLHKILPHRPLDLSPAALDAAKTAKIDLKAYAFPSKAEQLRSPRITRVGIFQNSIPLPTWTPIKDMRNAFYEIAKEVVGIAAEAKVNVFCFQEAWGWLLFRFCFFFFVCWNWVCRYAFCFLYA